MEVWLTQADVSELYQVRDIGPEFSHVLEDGPCILVDDRIAYQAMDGFGFTLTGGSALLIHKLDSEVREALLRELFSTEAEGIGVGYLRVSIGASALSAVPFTYDDMPSGEIDPLLSKFDLGAGDRELIPVFLAINPDIKLMGSP